MKRTNFSPQTGHYLRNKSDIGDFDIDDSGGGHQATHPAVLGLDGTGDAGSLQGSI